MKVENAVEPTGAQLESLIAGAADRPVHMVNLLKFRERAEYPDGADADLSGREAYMRYGGPMMELVHKAGGKLQFSGDVTDILVGEVEENWDMVAIMTYPSEAVMAEITQSPEFAAISGHRKAGLKGQLLLVCPDPAILPGG